MTSFNEENRFGSAAWANAADMARAGLFGTTGPMLGYAEQLAIRLDSDAPMITIGGAGSGKLRDVIAYNACGIQTWKGALYAPPRILFNDSRGEITKVSIENQARLGKEAYCVNIYKLHDLPQHRVNPWDILCTDSITFHADLKVVISDLIPLSGSPNAEYFELRARQWCEAMVAHYVVTQGSITMPEFYEMVNDVEDLNKWPDIAESMLNSASSEVRRTVTEMHTKRTKAPKEYGAIMGEIMKYLGFLSDPHVRYALSGSDFSLEVLCQRDCSVYLIIPAEYANQLAPMQRAIFSTAMLYKYRHPAAPRILFLVDEAATLGRFESLLNAYTYGRGMGIRVWSIWQDVSQISRNFGDKAVSSFLGSSQMRQFFGVRDLETAKMVSAMLGTQTLEYNADLERAKARHNRSLTIQSLLSGGDPVECGMSHHYQSLAARDRQKQARPLMTPDEILNMPENRQILFISGLGLMPIFAHKYPYFTRREMAGNYMPNPYHPPCDAVDIAGPKGTQRLPVVTERVPEVFANLPQYQSGNWSFIKGYRPKTTEKTP